VGHRREIVTLGMPDNLLDDLVKLNLESIRVLRVRAHGPDSLLLLGAIQLALPSFMHLLKKFLRLLGSLSTIAARHEQQNLVLVANSESAVVFVRRPGQAVANLLVNFVLFHNTRCFHLPDHNVTFDITRSKELSARRDRNTSHLTSVELVLDSDLLREGLQLAWRWKLRNQRSKVFNVDFLLHDSRRHVKIEAPFEMLLY